MNNNFSKYAGYAIVTDGLWRKSISAIRALGKAGYHVCVMGDSPLTTGFWSRYTTKRFICPTAEDDPAKFGQALLSLLSCYDNVRPVILPMEDASLLWCSKNREILKDKACLLLPSDKSLCVAEDKLETLKLAMRNEISCPATFFPESVEDFVNTTTTLPFNEYVLKPCHSSGSRGLVYLKKGQHFDFTEHVKKYGQCIIQERIAEEGDALGVSILMDDTGSTTCHFAHKRLEQYPNTGGPSTQRISIVNDDLLYESVRLLSLLKWKGVAMVEWKLNPKTGRYVLMEINPRFWGSLELAVRSGVNFPLLYAELAQNKPVQSAALYKVGQVCRWLLPGDILRYLTAKNRESIRTFLHSCVKQSEEWDPTDKRILVASLICQALLILNPKYWKFLR